MLRVVGELEGRYGWGLWGGLLFRSFALARVHWILGNACGISGFRVVCGLDRVEGVRGLREGGRCANFELFRWL